MIAAKTPTKRKYRYRDNGGATYLSLERAKHVQKLGPILSIKGYRYRGRYNAVHEGVMVTGLHGTARFNGYCWNYFGEGPRGLVEFLVSLGIPRKTAEFTAFYTERKDTIGVDWQLDSLHRNEVKAT